MRRRAREVAVRRRHRGLGAADVLLVSYPKSGSTWLRMLLAEALTGTEANFDSIRSSVPPIGDHGGGLALLPGGGRLIRSHEPLEPIYPIAGQRVVYLLRDARAVAVSYFHHSRRMSTHGGDLDAFCADFVAGGIGNLGPWSRHVGLALDRAREKPEATHLVRYEDLTADTATAVTAIMGFLGVAADDGAVARAVANNDATRMRDKEQQSTFLAGKGDVTNSVVRAGRARGWQDELSVPARKMFEDEFGEILTRAGYA
ncbi:MAG: hypothetical protein QOK39_1854 [Acidimicrobiaceae bacterium]|nr:hypothetical protein [Acidimicrobiaceae bacterium]